MTIPYRHLLLTSTTLIWTLMGTATFTQASQTSSELSSKETEDPKVTYKRTWKRDLQKALKGSVKKDDFAFTEQELEFFSPQYASLEPVEKKNLDYKIFNGISQGIQAVLENMFPGQKEKREKFNYSSLIIRECLDFLSQDIQINHREYQEGDKIEKFRFDLYFQELDLDLELNELFEDKKFFGKIIGNNVYEDYLTNYLFNSKNYAKDDPKSYGQYNGFSFRFKYPPEEIISADKDFSRNLQEKISQKMKAVQGKVAEAHDLSIVLKDIPRRDAEYGIPLEGLFHAKRGELHPKDDYEKIQKEEVQLSKIYNDKTIPTSLSIIKNLARQVEELKTQLGTEKIKSDNELKDKMRILRAQLDEEKESFKKDLDKEKENFKKEQENNSNKIIMERLEENSTSIKSYLTAIEKLTGQVKNISSENTQLKKEKQNLEKELSRLSTNKK